MAAVMRNGIPEVTAATHIYYTFMTLFAGDRQFREHIAAVDPNFFQVIKLPLMKGDTASVFRDPESVVVSESAARKYFGTTDAIGKFIRTTANCEATDAQMPGPAGSSEGDGGPAGHSPQFPSRWRCLHSEPPPSPTDRPARTAVMESADGCFTYVRLIPGARPETVLKSWRPCSIVPFLPSPRATAARPASGSPFT